LLVRQVEIERHADLPPKRVQGVEGSWVPVVMLLRILAVFHIVHLNP
jgi:hypothetical protein